MCKKNVDLQLILGLSSVSLLNHVDVCQNLFSIKFNRCDCVFKDM